MIEIYIFVCVLVGKCRVLLWHGGVYIYILGLGFYSFVLLVDR